MSDCSEAAVVGSESPMSKGNERRRGKDDHITARFIIQAENVLVEGIESISKKKMARATVCAYMCAMS